MSIFQIKKWLEKAKFTEGKPEVKKIEQINSWPKLLAFISQIKFD